MAFWKLKTISSPAAHYFSPSVHQALKRILLELLLEVTFLTKAMNSHHDSGIYGRNGRSTLTSGTKRYLPAIVLVDEASVCGRRAEKVERRRRDGWNGAGAQRPASRKLLEKGSIQLFRSSRSKAASVSGLT